MGQTERQNARVESDCKGRKDRQRNHNEPHEISGNHFRHHDEKRPHASLEHEIVHYSKPATEIRRRKTTNLHFA